MNSSSNSVYMVYSKIPENLNPTTKKIGTHSGSFHCDESLAIGLLSLLQEYKDGVVIRTRDEKILAECDIIVDVGAVYDPSRHRYDHHQASFKDTLNLDKFTKIRLSSAGLIYKHFGRQILEELIGDKATDEQKDDIYLRVYGNFIEHVDANDNGIEISDGELKYKITTALPNRVGRLNPKWNAPSDENIGFRKAIELTRNEFLESLDFYVNDWLPAYTIVEKAFLARESVDPSGEIIVVDQFCPWKEHLFVLEEKYNAKGLIKYALFQDVKGDWRVQAVPVEPGSFSSRIPLHKDWRGIRDAELSEKSAIPDCIFVHASGFIGGAKSFESALKMAQLSLRASTQVEEPEQKKTKQD
ncbi:hypothetical protein FDP41_008444 [Naegleria fowleri]|uniref:Uncharacterized protein n=1 Tax=Naegleria fowleri TaxID=5763 RepID=A0A6A5B630_NAEFO|nr:uncharacterized protein FDP41_008444 [Naegleria fowleri]KAF0973237.1 hypothetical protein FDP41_008444 [Naegleria fowleri]